MKTLNKICWILASVLGLGSLVLFFTEFVEIVTASGTANPVGAQLAFGSEVKVGDTAVKMAKSADIFVCFWLTAIAAVMSIFSFKSKKLRYSASAFGIGAAIYMLVVALAKGGKFIDERPLEYTAVNRTPFILITAIALVLFAVAAVAYLLIDDYLEAKESKGLTIPKRVVRFIRDYKSEVNKIVWPGLKEVAKNTVITLIMCLLVGILIWLADFGLGKLLNLILGA